MKQDASFDSELLTTLFELRRAHPDWRFGQMVANIAMAAGRIEACGVWDLEDDEALAAAKDILAQEATSPSPRR